MGNGNWVCFDCRETVRRPTHHKGDVPCPRCSQTCVYLGTKIELPGKRNVKAWQKLRVEFRHWQMAIQDNAWRLRIRQKHLLERQLSKSAKCVKKKDWRHTLGMFTGDKAMKRIDQNALKYRKEDRQKVRRRCR